VFQNPVGFGTCPAVSQAKACGLKSGETAFLSGSCSETEVSEQLYYILLATYAWYFIIHRLLL
jgi:hypothetical protein